MKPSTFTEKLTHFLGCKNPGGVYSEIYYVPEELIHVTELGLGRLLSDHYQVERFNGALDDKYIETHRRFLKMNPDKAASPTGGTFFLIDKQSPEAKLVLKINLNAGGLYETPNCQLYLAREKDGVSVEFFKRLHAAVKSLKGLHLDGAGKPIENIKKFRWPDVVLTDEVRQLIETNVVRFIQKWDLFQRRGIQMRRGILLYGQPGTGKSLLSIVLANETDTNLIVASPRHLYRPMGIASAFKLARSLGPPTILCLDDLDLIGGRDRNSLNTKELLGELLGQLDSYECNDGLVIIASTNDLSVFDKALAARPGRFDIKIEMPLPNDGQRTDLFKHLTKDLHLAEDVDVPALIKKTDGLSCAHLSELVNYAKILNTGRAVNGEQMILSQEDFAAALAVWNGHKKEVGFH